MKQRIFSHFQDYLIQYISHQYQDLLYCNISQYILSTYNSQMEILIYKFLSNDVE
jgi:hypothetical protein